MSSLPYIKYLNITLCQNQYYKIITHLKEVDLGTRTCMGHLNNRFQTQTLIDEKRTCEESNFFLKKNMKISQNLAFIKGENSHPSKI